MTDFEVFVRAIGRLTSDQRRTVLGKECVVYPLQEDLGYESFPKGAVAFGAMGVDGIHYCILKRDGEMRNDSPVIQFSPMDFSRPYALLGHTFVDYLSRRCKVSEAIVRGVLNRERAGEEILADFLRTTFSHDRIFDDGFYREIEAYADMLPPVDP